jgi:hypothetical protein
MHIIAVLKIITPNPGPYHLSFHLRGLKTEFFFIFWIQIPLHSSCVVV